MKDLLSVGKGPGGEPDSSAPTVDPSLRATVSVALHGTPGAALRMTEWAYGRRAYLGVPAWYVPRGARDDGMARRADGLISVALHGTPGAALRMTEWVYG
jgi:hypothetical protein